MTRSYDHAHRNEPEPDASHPNNTTTTLTVTFDAEFNEVERNLVSLGVDWHPHIDIIGYDGASGETELMRDAFPHTRLGVTVGNSSQTLRGVPYVTTEFRVPTSRKTPPATTKSSATFECTRVACRRCSHRR